MNKYTFMLTAFSEDRKWNHCDCCITGEVTIPDSISEPELHRLFSRFKSFIERAEPGVEFKDDNEDE